jgi:hypothetical protein
VSKLVEYGALVSVPIAVHVPAPAGERWKTTCVTPAGSEAEPVRLTLALRFAPGSSCVAVGPVWSTLTVRIPLVNVFPAASVVTARRS